MATKKPDDPTTEPVPASLADENAALRAQNDTVLDALIELQEQVKALQANQGAVAANLPAASDEQAKLDAEHVELMAEFADYPAIQQFERRAIVGVDANLAIRLVGDPDVLADPVGDACYWKLRWFNFSVEGRAQRAAGEGYIKVDWADLAEQDAVTTGDRTKPYVCKGDKGEEVLCKIPRKLYEYKKRRDAARLSGLLTSESQLRDLVSNGVARREGATGGNADQAGTFAHTGISMTITRGPTERVTPG